MFLAFKQTITTSANVFHQLRYLGALQTSTYYCQVMSDKRRVLLLSSSAAHGHDYLQFAKREITDILNSRGVDTVTFIPYALRNHDEYISKVKNVFNTMGFECESIHRARDPADAARVAQAFFIGGGNTFLLLKELYRYNLIDIIRERVLVEGIPYIGSSAGTNVATLNICTTNDMPIVYPPTFDALNLVSFNINPHYIEADPRSTHMGETRDMRIEQYHEFPGNPAVVGLREGAMLMIVGNNITLKGVAGARVFRPENYPTEYRVGDDLSFLFKKAYSAQYNQK